MRTFPQTNGSSWAFSVAAGYSTASDSGNSMGADGAFGVVRRGLDAVAVAVDHRADEVSDALETALVGHALVEGRLGVVDGGAVVGHVDILHAPEGAGILALGVWQ